MVSLNYLAEPNLLLEALSYLGARANGHTPEHLAERLHARGIAIPVGLQEKLNLLCHLAEEFDQAVALPEEQLKPLFGDLSGFPYNSTGTYSPAFLLFYAALGRFNGNLDTLLREMVAMTPDQIARHIMLALNLGEDLTASADGCAAALMDSVLSLQVPAESRLALLELVRNYRTMLPQIGAWLKPTLAALEQQRDTIAALSASLSQTLEKMGCEPYLRETSSLVLVSEHSYCLRPFLFGPDTNLTLDLPESPDVTIVYCGILRQPLQELLRGADGTKTRIYEAIKLLGDQTRFEILCYLRDHPAYGQELSAHFGLARNTIHHHMSKLINTGLVSAKVEGVRVYYSLNQAHLSDLLDQLRDLLA